jgi:hypothetical protein
MLVFRKLISKTGFTQNLACYYQGFFNEKRRFSTGKSNYPQPIVDIKNWKIHEKMNKGFDNYRKRTLQAGYTAYFSL